MAKNVTATAGHNSLMSSTAIAARFDADMMKHLDEAIHAKETDKKGPLVIKADFERLFTMDEICMWPVVGSKKGDGSTIWDIDEDMKPNAEGTLVKSRTSWWNDTADASAKSAALLVRKGKVEGKQGEFAGWGKDERKVEIGKINQAINTVRAAFRRAAQVIAQELELHNECEHVGFEIMKEADGSISSSTKPIKLWDDSKKGGSSDVVSVGTFLAFSPATAAAKAKTPSDQFSELLKTASREKKPTVTRSFELANFEEFDQAVAGLQAYMERVSGDAKQRIAFLKSLNAGGTDNVLLAMYTVNGEMDKFLSIPDVEKRLEILVANPSMVSAD